MANISIVERERRGSVEILVLNSPDTRNALNGEMRQKLGEAIERAASDPEVHALVLTGRGTAFCAGGDLRAMQEGIGVFAGRDKITSIHAWERTLLRMEKPTIAAVNGPAIGGGLGLALACDFVLASRTAKFGATFSRISLVPDYGLFYLLPRAVGMSRARDMILTGRMVGAEEFAAMGAVKAVSEPETLLEDALALAEQLCQTAPRALGLAKRLLQASYESSLDQMMELEALGQGLCYQSADHQEGVSAFLEKRPPHFRGE